MKDVLIALIAGGLVSGCSSTALRSLPFQKNHSRAYNLAQAAGLYDAEDYTAPKAQRDSVFGWAPISQAGSPDKAREVMSETLVAGAEAALSKAGITYKVDYRNLPQRVSFTHYLFSHVTIIAPEQRCPSWKDSGKELETNLLPLNGCSLSV